MRLRRLRVMAEAVSYRSPLLVRQIFQTDRGSTYPICPRCQCTIEREFMCYCDRCGQKLSWHLFSHATVRCVQGQAVRERRYIFRQKMEE